MYLSHGLLEYISQLATSAPLNLCGQWIIGDIAWIMYHMGSCPYSAHCELENCKYNDGRCLLPDAIYMFSVLEIFFTEVKMIFMLISVCGLSKLCHSYYLDEFLALAKVQRPYVMLAHSLASRSH